jgi:hypothetical protein
MMELLGFSVARARISCQTEGMRNVDGPRDHTVSQHRQGDEHHPAVFRRGTDGRIVRVPGERLAEGIVSCVIEKFLSLGDCRLALLQHGVSVGSDSAGNRRDERQDRHYAELLQRVRREARRTQGLARFDSRTETS